MSYFGLGFLDLHEACRNHDMDFILSFIKINKAGNGYNWGLGGACYGGHMDLVLLMISQGADNMNRGLEGACKGGHMDMVLFMIEKAGPEGLDWDWGLSHACQGGNMDIVHLMISHGARNWDRGLHGACFGGHMDTVLFMIEKASEGHIEGPVGLNWEEGLAYACQPGHMNIIHLMISYGASYNNILTSKRKKYDKYIKTLKEMYKNITNKLDISDCASIVCEFLIK